MQRTRLLSWASVVGLVGEGSRAHGVKAYNNCTLQTCNDLARLSRLLIASCHSGTQALPPLTLEAAFNKVNHPVDQEADSKTVMQRIRASIDAVTSSFPDQRALDDILSCAYRELLASKSINDVAVMRTIASSCRNDRAADRTLYSLLKMAEIRRSVDESRQVLSEAGVADAFDMQGVSVYDASELSQLLHSRVTVSQCPLHERASLMDNGARKQVWIEWKRLEAYIKDSPQDTAIQLEAKGLAKMLSCDKPCGLITGRCIALIVDLEFKGGQGGTQWGDGRYGWMFAMPEVECPDATGPWPLYSILQDPTYQPTLTDRFALALKLASSQYELLATGWTHHAWRSSSVLLVRHGNEYAYDKPILSGFDCSRSPVGPDYTVEKSLEPQWDIYRWPGIQNQPPLTQPASKLYDIYSLGLVLLEVMLQEPLHKLMGLEEWPDCWEIHACIRPWLLKNDYEKDPLAELFKSGGDKYHGVVKRCIVGTGDKGLRVTLSDDKCSLRETDLQLLQNFKSLVLDPLLSIVA